MRSLWFSLLGFCLTWAGHAPSYATDIAQVPAVAAEATLGKPQRSGFWTRVKERMMRPVRKAKALLSTLLDSERDLIRLLIIILIVALIVSLLVWFLPWPLDVLIMVLVLVVALIFLLKYIS
jgi:hypothetical protein